MLPTFFLSFLFTNQPTTLCPHSTPNRSRGRKERKKVIRMLWAVVGEKSFPNLEIWDYYPTPPFPLWHGEKTFPFFLSLGSYCFGCPFIMTHFSLVEKTHFLVSPHLLLMLMFLQFLFFSSRLRLFSHYYWCVVLISVPKVSNLPGSFLPKENITFLCLLPFPTFRVSFFLGIEQTGTFSYTFPQLVFLEVSLPSFSPQRHKILLCLLPFGLRKFLLFISHIKTGITLGQKKGKGWGWEKSTGSDGSFWFTSSALFSFSPFMIHSWHNGRTLDLSFGGERISLHWKIVVQKFAWSLSFICVSMLKSPKTVDRSFLICLLNFSEIMRVFRISAVGLFFTITKS